MYFILRRIPRYGRSLCFVWGNNPTTLRPVAQLRIGVKKLCFESVQSLTCLRPRPIVLTTPNCGSNRFTTSSVVGACRVRTSQGAEVSANGSLSWTGIGTHGPVPKAPLCLNFLHHHFSIPPLNGPNGSNGPSRSRSITKLPRRVDKGPMKLRFRHSAWDPKQMGNLQLENSFKWRISNC